MSYRRRVLDEVGGFNPRVGRIGSQAVGRENDETELCIRIRRRWPHHQLVYVPHAHVYHQVTAPRASWSYFVTRCYSEGMSKAYLARAFGADGLSAERSYTARTLPRGIVVNLKDSLTQRRVVHLGRAAAIVGGFAATVAGYGMGSLKPLAGRRQVRRDASALSRS
jgi:hypothetical protein